MTDVIFTANLDINPWRDLQGGPLEQHNPNGMTARIERVGLLPNGTQEGRTCVELLIRLPDDTVLIAETTLRMFHALLHLVHAAPVAQMENL